VTQINLHTYKANDAQARFLSFPVTQEELKEFGPSGRLCKFDQLSEQQLRLRIKQIERMMKVTQQGTQAMDDYILGWKRAQFVLGKKQCPQQQQNSSERI